MSMKINRLETHDRLLHFQKQADHISQGCIDCTNNRPPEFQNYPFYIFAHAREISIDERISIYNNDLQSSLIYANYIRQYPSIESLPTSRLIWSPRLTKPSAQENSMLFKAYPPGDTIRPIWLIPTRELWSQYKKDNMTENCLVSESVHAFINAKEKLEAAEEDDLPEERVKQIYMEIGRNAKRATSGAFQPLIST